MTIEELKTKTVGFISLGCDKNRVDLEKIIFNVSNFGFKIENDPVNANIIIVNTCSFLESARLESIENIIEMSNFKSRGKLERLIVTGCLNELGYPDLNDSLPEVDKFVNIKDNDNIIEIIAELYGISTNYKCLNDRILTTQNHVGYLKISDGCNNFCSYCLIPYIRGRFKSIPMMDLISEAMNLANKGVTELILVAQDVTKYGIDLYNKKMLVELIREISKIDNIKWIRLLYCYPEEIDDELISEIKLNNKVLKYLDIPLQHISSRILKSMNRRSNHESICLLFDKLKSNIKNIIIRTTFILGFPGETWEDIELIKDFLYTYQLYNVGFFEYSREEGTRAYDFPNQISDEEKHKRLEYLAKEQYDILQKINDNLIGKVFECIVDHTEPNYSIARFYGQAPQIDSVVIINRKLEIGKIYMIKITNKSDYDLEGEIYESTK